MKNYYYFFVVIFTVLLGCDAGELLIAEKTTGVVKLKDNYLETDTAVAPTNTVVLLGNNADKKVYLFKEVTNDKGEFSFKFFSDKAENYWLRSTLLLKEITYDGEINRKAMNNVLVLTPKYSDGIKVRVTRNNEPINGIKVYLYVNKIQADSARKAPSDDKITGFAFSSTTNLKGVALFPNLPDIDYYVYVRLQFRSDIILSEKKRRNNMLIGNEININF